MVKRMPPAGVTAPSQPLSRMTRAKRLPLNTSTPLSQALRIQRQGVRSRRLSTTASKEVPHAVAYSRPPGYEPLRGDPIAQAVCAKGTRNDEQRPSRPMTWSRCRHC